MLNHEANIFYFSYSQEKSYNYMFLKQPFTKRWRYSYTRILTYTNTHIHTMTHTYRHIHTHTDTYTHNDTHIHTMTQIIYFLSLLKTALKQWQKSFIFQFFLLQTLLNEEEEWIFFFSAFFISNKKPKEREKALFCHPSLYRQFTLL